MLHGKIDAIITKYDLDDFHNMLIEIATCNLDICPICLLPNDFRDDKDPD